MGSGVFLDDSRNSINKINAADLIEKFGIIGDQEPTSVLIISAIVGH